MSFNSPEYLLFLPVVTLLYFLLPHKFRWILLLTASYVFYMYWKPVYGFLLLASTSVSFFSALKIDSSKNTFTKKKWFALGLSSDLSFLFFFKYFNFMSDSANAISGLFHSGNMLPHLNILLPVGISFYTFQSLSYLIDVYRKKHPPETHFGKYALYISFFPQLVAGPIERSENLIPQLNEQHRFSLQRTVEGLRIILWGLFKKIVVADSIAIYVDDVFSNLSENSGLPLVLSMYLFAFFIYCDFSAYTNIAVGSAKILGVNLSLNFNKPFSARSFSEFWNRWHITLTDWVKDYIFKPLIGKNPSSAKINFFRLLAFLIIGLWHGASWNFALFGLLSGTYLVVSFYTQNIRERINNTLMINKFPVFEKYMDMFITVSLFASNTIFFRAPEFSDSVYIAQNIFAETRGNLKLIQLFPVIILIVIFSAIQSFQKDGEYEPFSGIKYTWLKWVIYLFLFFSVLIYLKTEHSNFHYYQF